MQSAILKALTDLVSRNPEALAALKRHIELGLRESDAGDDLCAAQLRLQAIEQEIGTLIQLEAQDGNQGNYDGKFEQLFREKLSLNDQIGAVQNEALYNEKEQSRLTEIFTELEKLKKRTIEWDETVIRQMIDTVRVLSRDRLRVSFRLGGEVEVSLAEN